MAFHWLEDSWHNRVLWPDCYGFSWSAVICFSALTKWRIITVIITSEKKKKKEELEQNIVLNLHPKLLWKHLWWHGVLRGDLTAAFQYPKGAYKQEENQLFTGVDNSWTRGNGFKLKEGRFRLGIDGSSLPRECWGAHTAAQRGCGCPIPGGVQGQAGWGSGQPGLVVGDPAHSRGGLKPDDHCGPFQPRPFYYYIIYTYIYTYI